MPALNHDCRKERCWLKVRHPKWEVFDDCFPDKCAISDIDGIAVNGFGGIISGTGIAEISGKAVLILEWKSGTKRDSRQENSRALQTLIRGPDDMLVLISGCPEQMTVRAWKTYMVGTGWSSVTRGDISELKNLFAYWATWADPKRATRIPL